MIKLGQKVKDLVTGFEGIVTAKCVYLNGCVQYCVKPTISKDGTMPDGVYIDYQQLQVIDDGLSIQQKITGGIMGDKPRDCYRG